MRLSQKCSAFAVAAATLAVYSASTANAADTINSFVVPGAKPFYLLPFVGHDDIYNVPTLGEYWYDYADSNPTLLNYPRAFPPLTGINDPSFGSSVNTGVATLNSEVLAAGTSSPIVITGLSEGTVVVDHEEALLAANPSTAPAPSDITFIVISDVSRSTPLSNSLLSYFPQLPIPGLNYTNTRPPVTPYNTTVIVGEYDMFADFPDRPWDLLSVINSVFASQTVHGDVAFSDPSQVPASNIVSTTNALGGVTTTYLVPTPMLPMLAPLLSLGVPTQIVNELNAFFKPLVDAGYSRNDGNSLMSLMPYFQTTSGAAVLVFPLVNDIVSGVKTAVTNFVAAVKKILKPASAATPTTSSAAAAAPTVNTVAAPAPAPTISTAAAATPATVVAAKNARRHAGVNATGTASVATSTADSGSDSGDGKQSGDSHHAKKGATAASTSDAATKTSRSAHTHDGSHGNSSGAGASTHHAH